MNLVVDASVVIKWYAWEVDSADAERVLETDGLIIAPGHMLGEVGEILVRLSRTGKFTDEQMALARTALPRSVLLVFLDHLFANAVDIALATGATVYDCLYVAAAVRWETVLVMADANLLRALVGTAWEQKAVLLSQWVKSQ